MAVLGRRGRALRITGALMGVGLLALACTPGPTGIDITTGHPCTPGGPGEIIFKADGSNTGTLKISLDAAGNKTWTCVPGSTTTTTTTTTTTAPEQDTTLEIDKEGPIAGFPGQTIVFTISVKNTGAAKATGVEIVDTLPAVGSFVSSDPAGTPAAPAPGGTYTIPLPDIDPGATAEATLSWEAPDEVITLVNSATASADNAPSVGPDEVSVAIGVETTCNPCGVAAGGTGLRNRDSGTITIDDVPAGAVVGRAVLVWGILYDGTTPPANTITFEGSPVAADLTATVSGSLCWSDDNTVGYAADVTSLVSGNGTYEITDPIRGETRIDADPAGTLPFTDGATLLVFYVGGGQNAQVISDFSYDTNTDTDRQINRSFSGINSVGSAASLIMAGPDGQTNGGETFTITGSSPLVLNNTWDGSDPQVAPSFSIGNLWDTDVYDVSSLLPAGQETLTFAHTQSGDCIGVGAAVLTVSQDATT